MSQRSAVLAIVTIELYFIKSFALFYTLHSDDSCFSNALKNATTSSAMKTCHFIFDNISHGERLRGEGMHVVEYRQL